MQHRAGKGEANQPEHGIGQYRGRSRPADTIVQNEHDADQNYRKYGKNTAAAGTELEAEGHDHTDQQSDQTRAQGHIRPARAKTRYAHMAQMAAPATGIHPGQ